MGGEIDDEVHVDKCCVMFVGRERVVFSEQVDYFLNKHQGSHRTPIPGNRCIQKPKMGKSYTCQYKWSHGYSKVIKVNAISC